MREMYKLLARQYGIPWEGRRYDRNCPEKTNAVNMAVNHAAVATRAAAEIAVAATATIPQLGFIHEDSSLSFALDIADLFRDEFTLPVAFGGYKRCLEDASLVLEREVRTLAGATMRRNGLIPSMMNGSRSFLVPMTVVVTRNVSGRTRGFLASCMLEVAPSVYCAPRMSKGVRDRVKSVLDDWFLAEWACITRTALG